MFEIQPEHMDRFSPPLRELLDAQLAAGNEVVETGAGWPRPESISVTVARPFTVPPEMLPPGVLFREVNDPHWWQSEYWHEASRHLLICRYACG